MKTAEKYKKIRRDTYIHLNSISEWWRPPKRMKGRSWSRGIFIEEAQRKLLLNEGAV